MRQPVIFFTNRMETARCGWERAARRKTQVSRSLLLPQVRATTQVGRIRSGTWRGDSCRESLSAQACNLDPVTPQLLGAVHGAICLTHQLLGRLVALRAHAGHAKAGRDNPR